ncbi:MAG: DUF2079 domain-containing protein [Thermoplasmata archaeon]
MTGRIRGALGRWPTRRWLYLLVVIFFAASLTATTLNYVNFHGQDEYDLSINQQALATTFHGNNPHPFYEAVNCGRNDRCSFLLVHPVLLAYALAPLYGVAPSAFTLFAIQSFALGLAAIPLYLLALARTRSTRLSLATAAIYLAWMPSFSGIFSFHWEAFIPAEIFMICWLWDSKRYLLSVPVILIGFITLEVMPVLIFFVGLFFLTPCILRGLGLIARTGRSLVEEGGQVGTQSVAFFAWLRRSLRAREVQMCLALMVGSLVAYIFLHEFVQYSGWFLDLPALPTSYHIGLNQPIHAISFSLSTVTAALQQKLSYWLVLFATLGFIPFLAPRALVIIGPWFAFTFVGLGVGLHTLGNHYAFIAGAVLFVGFVYGLERLHRWSRSWRAPAPVPVEEPGTPEEPGADAGEEEAPDEPAWRWRRNRRPTVVAGVLGAIIVLNVFLNPLNPLTGTLVPSFGAPFPNAYGVEYSVPAGFQSLERLASLVPNQAVVGATYPLFSLVANDPYAYPFTAGMTFSNLPGAAGDLPQFVLISNGASTSQGASSINSTLKSALDSSQYGVRGFVPTSPVGGAILFEQGFTGNTTVFGPSPTLSTSYYTPGHGMVAGSVAHVVKNSTGLSGSIIQSFPSFGNGTVFTGPIVALPAGSYTIQTLISGYPSIPSHHYPSNFSVMNLYFNGFGRAKFLNLTLNASDFVRGIWATISIPFQLTEPIIDLSLAGVLLPTSGKVAPFVVQLDCVILTPNGPPTG